jgi:hypothetical protein
MIDERRREGRRAMPPEVRVLVEELRAIAGIPDPGRDPGD